MSPSISKVRHHVSKSMEAALVDPRLQVLIDEGLISPEPHRYTMEVELGLFGRKVRFIRNPNWRPNISDLM